MLGQFRAAINAAEADPRVVGIIITGAGRGFCAGLDADALKMSTSPGGRESTESSSSSTSADPPGLFSYLLKVGKPIIACVNGPSAGGGFVLTLMSDIRFASTEGSFTTVFSKRGLISEHGSSWILPRIVGTGRALDMLWSSRKVGAQEALRIGLVEDVVAPDQLVPHAIKYIKDMAAVASPGAIRDTKKLVYADVGRGYQEALVESNEMQWKAIARPDAREGTMSLIEKRAPKFTRLGGKDAKL